MIKEFPIAHEIYESKQVLKAKLTEIEAENIDALRKALSQILRVPHFKSLQGKDVIIDTGGLPGEAYLGQVID